MPKGKPSYGLDAPGLVRGFLLGGPVLFVAGWYVQWAARLQANLLLSLGSMMSGIGIVFFVQGLLMIGSSYYGKFRAMSAAATVCF
jgi:hypothetical protein